MLHPLNNLLRTGQKWTWTKECTRAFEEAKKLLVIAPVLAHYDYEDGWWCVSLWHWGIDFPCLPWWEWMADCLCITNSDHCWEELSSNWVRGLVTCVQDMEVPPVSVWMPVCSSYRSQATCHLIRAQEEGTTLSSCSSLHNSTLLWKDMEGEVVYWTVLCYHAYLVSMLFGDLLSLHLVTFLMFFILVRVTFLAADACLSWSLPSITEQQFCPHRLLMRYWMQNHWPGQALFKHSLLTNCITNSCIIITFHY